MEVFLVGLHLFLHLTLVMVPAFFVPSFLEYMVTSIYFIIHTSLLCSKPSTVSLKQ